MRKFSPKRILWICLGCICVGLGTVGMFLPLLPTTSFMLVAAFAFARSSPRLHAWLINHKIFGKLITDWHEHRAISTKAKVMSVISMAVIVGISILMHVPAMVLFIQIIVLACVATFLLSRPAPPISVAPSPIPPQA